MNLPHLKADETVDMSCIVTDTGDLPENYIIHQTPYEVTSGT